MFLQYSEDFFIFVGSISYPSFVNPNIISYSMFIRLFYLKTDGYKVLYTSDFFLTC